MTLSPRALRLPPPESAVWKLAGRKRRGERLSRSEDLRIAEGLAFPTVTGVLDTLAVALHAAGADHALVGGLAIGALTGKPRATVDADLIVRRPDIDILLDALTERFGPLDVARHRGLVRVAEPAIDLIVAGRAVLRRQAIAPENVVAIDLGPAPIRLPTHESAVILKYASAVSPTRSDDASRQDLVDLGRLLAASPDLDLDRVAALKQPLRFRRADEIVEIVNTLRAGGVVGVTKRATVPKVVCVMPQDE